MTSDAELVTCSVSTHCVCRPSVFIYSSAKALHSNLNMPISLPRKAGSPSPLSPRKQAVQALCYHDSPRQTYRIYSPSAYGVGDGVRLGPLLPTLPYICTDISSPSPGLAFPILSAFGDSRVEEEIEKGLSEPLNPSSPML